VTEESTVEFLASVELLSAFRKEDLEQLATRTESRWFDFGDAVCEAGDTCEGVYLVKSGTVRLFSEKDGKEVSMGVRKAGDVFAELAALREHRHEYSVRASAKTELLILPGDAITQLLAQNDDATSFVSSYVAIRTAGGAINRLFDLKGKVAQAELEQLVRSVGVKKLGAERVILEQGSSKDQRLYFVRQGKVKIVREEDGTETPIASLQQGDVFGESVALNGGDQPLSAIAETDVVLLVVPEDSLKLVLEKNPQVREFLEARIKSADRELQRQKKLAERRGQSSFLDLGSKAGRGERVVARFPLVEQAEEMDCGAACLAMICKHYNLPMTLGKLREMANVTTEGATLDSLAKVGESLGFATRGVQCTYEALLGFDMPFIAHWEGYHYIIRHIQTPYLGSGSRTRLFKNDCG